jgi:hypothetical protein
MAWLHMAHTGPLPPIWVLLDLQPSAETLHLLSLVEFTDLVRNAFVILRMVATARYLHLKSQELYEALIKAHGILAEDADERVRLREEGPAIAVNAQRVLDLTDQLAAMSNQHQEAQAAAAFNAEHARLAEWDAGQLRGQIGLVQRDLARAQSWPTRKWRTWTIG